MPCPAGLQLSTYILPSNYGGTRKGSVFLQHFLKFFIGEAFLNFHSKVIPKSLHGIRVNLFHDELSVAEEGTMYFPFINIWEKIVLE